MGFFILWFAVFSFILLSDYGDFMLSPLVLSPVSSWYALRPLVLFYVNSPKQH